MIRHGILDDPEQLFRAIDTADAELVKELHCGCQRVPPLDFSTAVFALSQSSKAGKLPLCYNTGAPSAGCLLAVATAAPMVTARPPRVSHRSLDDLQVTWPIPYRRSTAFESHPLSSRSGLLYLFFWRSPLPDLHSLVHLILLLFSNPAAIEVETYPSTR